MKFSEFKYLGRRPLLRRRNVGDRKITKVYYINPLLSVKLVNKYTLICINELELMTFTSKGSEFDKWLKKLKQWYNNNYNLDLIEFKIGFPLLWELSNLGDSNARETYYRIIHQKEKLDLLVNLRMWEFFTNIYRIYQDYLEEGVLKHEWINRIKLYDLCLLYYTHYQINSFENDFYLMIWTIIKKNLNLPFSISNTNLIKDIFSLFEVDFWNYKNSRFDYGRLYNSKFFEEILNPLLQRIFKNKTY